MSVKGGAPRGLPRSAAHLRVESWGGGGSRIRPEIVSFIRGAESRQAECEVRVEAAGCAAPTLTQDGVDAVNTLSHGAHVDVECRSSPSQMSTVLEVMPCSFTQLRVAIPVVRDEPTEETVDQAGHPLLISRPRNRSCQTEVDDVGRSLRSAKSSHRRD